MSVIGGSQRSPQAVRRAGAQLREEGKEGPPKIVEGLAERGELLGGYLERADGDHFLGDVESLGRKQPWLFAAVVRSSASWWRGS